MRLLQENVIDYRNKSLLPEGKYWLVFTSSKENACSSSCCLQREGDVPQGKEDPSGIHAET